MFLSPFLCFSPPNCKQTPKFVQIRDQTLNFYFFPCKFLGGGGGVGGEINMLTLLHQAFTSLHTSVSGRSLLSFWDQVSGFKQLGVKSEVFHRKFSVLTPLAQTGSGC